MESTLKTKNTSSGLNLIKMPKKEITPDESWKYPHPYQIGLN